MPLNKKEQLHLRHYGVKVEKATTHLDPQGHGNTFAVFLSLTKGQLLALRNGMRAYGEVSPVGRDVSIFIDNALARDGINIDD